MLIAQYLLCLDPWQTLLARYTDDTASWHDPFEKSSQTLSYDDWMGKSKVCECAAVPLFLSPLIISLYSRELRVAGGARVTCGSSPAEFKVSQWLPTLKHHHVLCLLSIPVCTTPFQTSNNENSLGMNGFTKITSTAFPIPANDGYSTSLSQAIFTPERRRNVSDAVDNDSPFSSYSTSPSRFAKYYAEMRASGVQRTPVLPERNFEWN